MARAPGRSFGWQPSLYRVAGRLGAVAHGLDLPMLPVPPGHLEMREKHQHTIQRHPPAPPAPPPRPGLEHTWLLPHTIILPSAWVAQPSPGGRRTGSSVLPQAGLLSTPSPTSSVQLALPQASLAGFLRDEVSYKDSPCLSRIFSTVSCT